MNEDKIFAAALRLAETALADYLLQACGDDELLRERIEQRLAAHAENKGRAIQGDAGSVGDLNLTADPAPLVPQPTGSNTDDFANGADATIGLPESKESPESPEALDLPDSPDWVGSDELATLKQVVSAGERGQSDPPQSSGDLSSGQWIGPYRLVRPMGEGGMGAVWLAEQLEPIKRNVAIKVVKPGIGSRDVLARFEAERQALALMDHPNIARILDAGATENGQPFFAMELVEGRPLTSFCDHHRLSIADRLELFVDVCSGVQHAHQKGIIHRDLKPSNILVTIVDGKPVAKVIDFGLAKALDSTHRLTDQSMFTGIGQILGTLKYMSPEQASLEEADIDIRTDIYSLGIVLYELLVAATPLDDSSIQGQAVLSVLSLIREQEAVKPSSQVSSRSDERVSRITGDRKTDVNHLRKVLAGDLDWIVMKALEKERPRRYESASGFADDVRRFLHSEPVVARPPSLNYRLQKFIRKHRAAVLAAATVLVALMAGMVGTTWGLLEAERGRTAAVAAGEALSRALEEEAAQRELAVTRQLEAEAAREQALAAKQQEQLANASAQKRLKQVESGNELLASIFEDLDIRLIRGGTEPLEAVLAKKLINAGEQLTGESIGDPLIVAQMQDRLSRSLTNLGYAAEAVGLSEASLRTRSQLIGDAAATISSVNNLALAYDYSGRVEEAVPLYERALEWAQKERGEEHKDTLTAMNNLGGAYQEVGKLEEALSLLEKTLTLRKSISGEDHIDTLASMSNLASCYRDAGQSSKGLKLMEQAVATATRELGERHTHTLTFANNLAMFYQHSGQLDKGLKLLERTLKLRGEVLGSTHPDSLSSASNLAGFYYERKQYAPAIELFEQLLEYRREHLGADHLDTLKSMNNLGGAYRAAGRIDEALLLWEQTLKLQREKHGEDHPDTLRSMNNLAAAYWTAKQLHKSIPLFEELIAKSEQRLGRTHPDTLLSIANLGVNYRDAGRSDRAIALLEEVVAVKGIQQLEWAGPQLLALYVTAKMPRKFTELATRRLADLRKTAPPASELAQAMVIMSDGYVTLQLYDSAEELLRETLELCERQPAQRWLMSNVQFQLGKLLQVRERSADAEPLLESALEGITATTEPVPAALRTRQRISVLEHLIQVCEALEKSDDADKHRDLLKRLSATNE